MNRRSLIGSLVAVGLASVMGYARADDTEALAKAAQNPIAAMISLPFQNNTNFDVGPEGKTQNVLNIQPVIPFGIDPEWNVVTRTILPVMSQPPLEDGGDRVTGIGDTEFTAWLSPAKPGPIVWGVGPVLQLPTSSNDALGSKRWGIGPSVVLLHSTGHWLYGALANNIWSVTGPSSAPAFNQMLVQPFVNYNLADGWYLTSSPIVTADWKASDENRWTVPLGGGVGKIFRIGEQPINAQAQGFYNVVTPDDGGARWTLRLQLQFLFPK